MGACLLTPRGALRVRRPPPSPSDIPVALPVWPPATLRTPARLPAAAPEPARGGREVTARAQHTVSPGGRRLESVAASLARRSAAEGPSARAVLLRRGRHPSLGAPLLRVRRRWRRPPRGLLRSPGGAVGASTAPQSRTLPGCGAELLAPPLFAGLCPPSTQP